MRSYEAARNLFSFLGFLAWCAIVIGVVLALVGANEATEAARFYGSRNSGSAAFAGMIPGLVGALLGFVFLALVQMGRATVDTAEYTQQMLKIARDQLEVSKQGLRKSEPAADGFAALNAAKSELATGNSSQAKSFADLDRKQQAGPEAEHEIGSTVTYRGETLRVVGAGYVLRDRVFSSYEEVTKRIDATLPLELGRTENSFEPAPKPIPPLAGVTRD